jgi:hypothetical protein
LADRLHPPSGAGRRPTWVRATCLASLDMRPGLPSCLALSLLLSLAGSACDEFDAPPSAGTTGQTVHSHEVEEPTSSGRLWAMLINGGGSPERNYQSHLLHVSALVDLLKSAGVPQERTAVFASDGPDPAADLAVRDPEPERNFWLIEGLPAGSALAEKTYLENSHVDGVDLRPATATAIASWLGNSAAAMRAGDTLLVYVTDHGSKNRDDTSNNAIVLWHESLSVAELRTMLAGLPTGVRVVMLMSQCFSGSFAYAAYADGGRGEPTGNTCGYFSSTPERMAYGCYPENRGKGNVGHSFRFIEALRAFDSFAKAEDWVDLTDRTPDVPNRTSDHYLSRLVTRAAAGLGLDRDSFIDRLLEQAWLDEAHYRDLFARIDEMGKAFGAFGPRSVAELDRRISNLPDLSRDLQSYARRWGNALLNLKRENFMRFLQAQPHWREYVAPSFLATLDGAERDRIRGWLLEDLGAFTDADTETRRRLDLLRKMQKEAEKAHYRMEVRLGAALRIRALLERIAGLVYLDRHADEDDVAAFERLEACEDLTLGRHRLIPLPRPRPPQPFPPLGDELELLAAVLPGWLGVDYAPADPRVRRTYDLGDGAVVVTRVYPGSPAARGGIRVGDVLVGAPGEVFAERNQIREWIMTSIVDEVRELEILRDGELLTVELRMGSPPA